MATTVVNVKTDEYDVYIGRPMRGYRAVGFGNPFVIGRDGSREEVIAKYAEWIQTQPQLLARLPELKNKVLGCWCAPELCHGSVLARLADELE